MAFMVPEIFKGTGYDVELQDGSSYVVPSDIIEGPATKKELDQYRPESAGFSPVIGLVKLRGYFAHLTAPGYMDQTDWEFFATKKELDEWTAEQEEDEEEDEEEEDDDDARGNPHMRPLGVPRESPDTPEERTREVGYYMKKVKVTQGQKIKTWGGWYAHHIVTLGGVEIGRIQTRRRNKRTETITLGMDNNAVIGHNVEWLVREYLKKVPV